jgi:holo-[acyl-carrier protein] synthase
MGNGRAGLPDAGEGEEARGAGRQPTRQRSRLRPPLIPLTESSLEVLGIGLDLVEIARFQELLDRFGGRMKKRLFTGVEDDYCASHAIGHQAQHYAARFAAKEAWIKASGIAIAWREIEVVNRAGTGVPELILHGQTVAASRAAGIARALLTITHAGDLAVAQVTCLGRR